MGSERIFDVVVVTVTLSALLHGVTAAPLARRYAAYTADATEDMPEMMEVAELPTRVRYTGPRT